ncbi:BirA family biotin operon repressor/biotin-[acetyl-CoA-carboxylase] ligase [Melghiribacillus thermohalophilus]|uniref:Bifunctional ligase/repressor BirA n=1 Tax=Melghiribacillus thermohalophilus TaxID=1324956 RepID=A0A4R3N871_9BACI|nr:biotin--[acetyl-CoA-carboxylase] ligase [Melghiribacillus thermohalophilus]TCT25553.1 BirA family biotin operon repressor/biotin-[acetyl-CoA-carboxylase] ligase [Melghiribacillus thermohalophilus]
MESTRRKLIDLLSRYPDEFVSGQVLSEQLNITRSAIWKHMKELEKDGYVIQSVPRKGYRILKNPDKLSANTIQWGLSTNWLGSRVIFEKTTDSTQVIAHHLGREGAQHGTVVVADEQVKGRGRLNRTWYSKKGDGIWMSLILRPEVEPQQAPQLTLLSAVAIVEALEEITDLAFYIKWPNDIYVHDHKIAGILTEMQAEQDQINYIVQGIGLNVNQNREDFNMISDNEPTSLKIETGMAWNRRPLIQVILQQIERLYERYLKEGFLPIKTMWEERAYRLGQPIMVSSKNQNWQGIFKGIDQDGALIVTDQKGRDHVLYSAEINWRSGGHE